MNKTYCFDLDGTLCTNTEGDYDLARPFPERIRKVNELFQEGNQILIFTARGTMTGIDWRKLTELQLDQWGVKYHNLALDKPFAHVYIDDRGVSDVKFFDEE